jgi:hypothetical protein
MEPDPELDLLIAKAQSIVPWIKRLLPHERKLLDNGEIFNVLIT